MTVDGDKILLETEKAHKKTTDDDEYEFAVSNKQVKASATFKEVMDGHQEKIDSPPSFAQRFTDLEQWPGNDGKFMVKISSLPQTDSFLAI